MDRFIGKILDNRYEILEVIGVGGMAVVYKAKCHRLNRFVALKILKDEYASDEEFRNRFHEESQAVAMLSDPNIVAVYDVSRVDNVEYIVMELIEGVSLKEYLERRGPLTWKETTFFSIQIAKALQHAHSRGIIHRDIKPQNIMLLRDGTLKVADFGIAHQVARQTTYSNGEAIGSVHYVSPEQAKGSHIDTRSDLYSFGVVMYEMLAGRLPFEGDTPISVALQHINSIALPPSDYVEGIPPVLEAITMKAMSPSLAKRYASATDILHDLEAFKDDPEFKVNIEKDALVAPTECAPADATIKLSRPEEMRLRDENGNGEHQAHKKSVMVKDREEKEHTMRERRLPTSLLFSIIALVVFFGGAIYFMITVINPFGTPDNEKIPAPTLTNLMYDEIITNWQYGEFNIVEGERVYHNTVPAGAIISQSPVAGRSIKKGDEITVVISRGPKTVTLNNYKGLEYRQAEIELDRLGIAYVEQKVTSDEVAKDMIISTKPEHGTLIQSGDVVSIVISLGKEMKSVVAPNLMGKTLDSAEALLKEALLVRGEIVYIDSEEPDGTVIFQNIPAGASVEEATVVDIQLSRQKIKPPPVEPPVEPPVDPSVEPPTEPDVPAVSTDKTISYKVTLMNSENAIAVNVLVDGTTLYIGTHYTSEFEITVPLSASEGDHYVAVIQNGVTTTSGTVTFK